MELIIQNMIVCKSTDDDPSVAAVYAAVVWPAMHDCGVWLMVDAPSLKSPQHK